MDRSQSLLDNPIKPKKPKKIPLFFQPVVLAANSAMTPGKAGDERLSAGEPPAAAGRRLHRSTPCSPDTSSSKI